jgi:hypothetical protein
MPAPTSLTIRTYNVGFGDCFLLKFDYGKSQRRILIDYGSTAAPARAAADYMLRVAKDIREQCRNADGTAKLHGVVVTHRHRDHLSGFATGGVGTGKIIASLQPDVVVQPWTEDPNAKPDAKAAASGFYTAGKPSPAALRAQYVSALADMHAVAEAVHREALSDTHRFGVRTQRELAFLGDDNGLPNRSAVVNLMEMGRKGRAAYVHCGSKSGLDAVLPGVDVQVLGPPDLTQTQTILKERARYPNEYWHLAFSQYRTFWRTQALAADGAAQPGAGKPLFPNAATFGPEDVPANLRWFVRRAQRLRGAQLLDLVHSLDDAMNNTSVILLFRVGGEAVLFPGDAQIENWSYALAQPALRKLLAEVTVYKVGHHGSLNATPKSLWNLFRHKSAVEGEAERLKSVLSTKSGKHGNAAQKTEVPRRTLVAKLAEESDLFSTQTMTKSEAGHDIRIDFARKE